MLIGNLGADPEVRSTNNGSRVANLSLATSRQWTGQGGEKQEKTEWHRVICWNNKGAQLADLAEKYMKKGDRIYVEGRIEYRTWEDREKQTRYVTEIRSEEHTSELQSLAYLVCRLLLEKKKINIRQRRSKVQAEARRYDCYELRE